MNDARLSIVILAAGQGTRMKSSLPKVLHEVGGKPLLAHVIDTTKKLTPTKTIIVYGHEGEAVQAAFPDPALTWVFQAQQRGTGDAIAKALPALDPQHRVLILYGDVPLITEQTLHRLLHFTPAEALGMVTMRVTNPTGFGRIKRDANGMVQAIIEERDANVSEKQITEINTGIYLVPAKYLIEWIPQLKNDNNQKEYYLTDIIDMAVKGKVAIATTYPNEIQEVLGVNDRLQLNLAERYYQRFVAQKHLLEGVKIADPDRFDLRGVLTADSDVEIDINVVLIGEVILRKGVRIGPNCVLNNCDIGSGTTIAANSYLENVIVGNYCNIGPFARLRPGTLLADGVRIGNFVEVKKSQIGAGSKISHLSYIGDTVMGKEVNVGAGAITCNYDGINKHETIIEDNVRIGADSLLVAPIRVGKGAQLGAGSTLTQDAPPHQLTLTHRLEQRSRPLSDEKILKEPEKQ